VQLCHEPGNPLCSSVMIFLVFSASSAAFLAESVGKITEWMRVDDLGNPPVISLNPSGGFL